MDIYYTLAIVLILLVTPKFLEYFVCYYLYLRKRSDKNSLASQVLAYRKELKTISQVDEFAKYSKVQRKLKAAEQQYENHMRKDLEIQVTYVSIGKLAVYLLTVIFSFYLVYQLLFLALHYTGVYPSGDERAHS